ncbi:MAG: hypothetical protein KAT17_05450 [Candidatus Aminicenantes bacterium]|nr:hypothetical protein [Candidatus Aminicenantes bacterium]
MNIINSMIKSLRVNNLKIALYMWLFNLIFSSIIIYVFFKFISAFGGRSIMFKNLTLNEFSIYFIDIFQHNNTNLTLILSLVFLVTFIFILMSIFISGGAYSILLNNEQKTFKNLFSLSTEHFFKIFKIFLINLINFAFLSILSGFFLYLIWNIHNHSGNETLFKIFIYIWICFTILIMIITIATYDFSRIIKLKTGRNIYYSFINGLRFVFSNKLVVLLIFLLYLIAIGFFHLVLSAILNQLGNALPFLFAVFIYQIFIILKYYLKTLIIHTEINFMSS